MASIANQIVVKTGEVAYIIGQIKSIFDELNFSRQINIDRLRNYVRDNDLLVDLDGLGIKRAPGGSKSYVLKSNLLKIVGGNNLSEIVRIEDVNKVACELGYQT